MPGTDISKQYFRLLGLSLLAVFFIIYISFARYFGALWQLTREVAPLVILVGAGILLIGRDHRVYRRRRAAGEEAKAVYLTDRDAMLHDVTTFLAGALVAAVPLTAHGLDSVDIIQTLITVTALWYLRYHYFHRPSRD